MGKRRSLKKPGALQVLGKSPGQWGEARHGVKVAREARKHVKEVRKEGLGELARAGEMQRQAKEIRRLAREARRGEGPAAEQAARELEERTRQLQEEALGQAERMGFEVGPEHAGEGAPPTLQNPYSGQISEPMERAVEAVVPGLTERIEEIEAERNLFEVRFGRDGYGAGEVVDGFLVAKQPLKKARTIEVELGYVEESSDYADVVPQGTTGSLHKGGLEAGRELPFSLRVPPDAPPNWVQGPGQVYWALIVGVNVPRGRDVEELHRLPLSGDPAAWRVPAPAPAEPSESRTRRFDASIEPDRRELRRGEEVGAQVAIGKPAADRTGLGAALRCEVYYDEETTDSDGDRRRSTLVAKAHEEWATLDPSLPNQQVRFRVPLDAPFSYGKANGKGTVVAYAWKLVVREDKRLRRDPRHEVTILVAP